MALILYDFAAYLSTDLIQPGIINVVREFDADVSLAPAAVSLSRRRDGAAMAAGAAFRPDRSSSGIGHGGAHFFPRLYRHAVHHFNDTVSGRARGAGHQHLLYRDGRLRHGAGGVRTNESHQADGNHHLYRAGSADHWPAFRCGADALRPLEGAVRHYCGNGFYRLMGLLLAMPETVQRGAVPFGAISVVRDFRDVFRNRVFLFGVATISLSYIPMMSWVAVSPVILIDAGGMTSSQFAWVQGSVFGAVIVANMVVARL